MRKIALGRKADDAPELDRTELRMKVVNDVYRAVPDYWNGEREYGGATTEDIPEEYRALYELSHAYEKAMRTIINGASAGDISAMMAAHADMISQLSLGTSSHKARMYDQGALRGQVSEAEAARLRARIEGLTSVIAQATASAREVVASREEFAELVLDQRLVAAQSTLLTNTARLAEHTQAVSEDVHRSR